LTRTNASSNQSKREQAEAPQLDPCCESKSLWTFSHQPRSRSAFSVWCGMLLSVRSGNEPFSHRGNCALRCSFVFLIQTAADPAPVSTAKRIVERNENPIAEVIPNAASLGVKGELESLYHVKRGDNLYGISLNSTFQFVRSKMRIGIRTISSWSVSGL
jgi:hypothetical protein